MFSFGLAGIIKMYHSYKGKEKAMKIPYSTPKMTVTEIKTADVISTSTTVNGQGGNYDAGAWT